MNFEEYLLYKEKKENEEHRQFIGSLIPQDTASSVNALYIRLFDPPYESEDESEDDRKYGNGSKYRCLYNDQLERFSNKKKRMIPCYGQTLKGQELREDPFDKKYGNTWVYSKCSKECSTCGGTSPGCGKDTRKIRFVEPEVFC
jgi:hypothetical protein